MMKPNQTLAQAHWASITLDLQYARALSDMAHTGNRGAFGGWL